MEPTYIVTVHSASNHGTRARHAYLGRIYLARRPSQPGPPVPLAPIGARSLCDRKVGWAPVVGPPVAPDCVHCLAVIDSLATAAGAPMIKGPNDE